MHPCFLQPPPTAYTPPTRNQERADDLAAREGGLEAWKAQFKAEAVRQIAERERLLTEWQARLDRRGGELEEAQRAAEVRFGGGALVGETSAVGCGCRGALQLPGNSAPVCSMQGAARCMPATCCMFSVNATYPTFA